MRSLEERKRSSCRGKRVMEYVVRKQKLGVCWGKEGSSQSREGTRKRTMSKGHECEQSVAIRNVKCHNAMYYSVCPPKN